MTARWRGLRWVWPVVGLAASGIALLTIFSGLWPLTARCAMSACAEGREWLKAIVTGAVFVAGLLQYRRSQQWERAKFLASEMKAFLGQAKVQNALTMVDWSQRQINLYGQADATKWPLITRLEQTHALLPHKVDALIVEVIEEPKSAGEAGARDSGNAAFTANDAAIRDCFDALLDGLEQFASYVDTGLMGVNDLRPYLEYWITDIAAVTGDEEDDQWTSALLSYIDFYGYRGVQSLFMAFGHDIAAGHPLFDKFLKKMRIVDPIQLRNVVMAERGDTGMRSRIEAQ